ncbi:MAG: transcriptional repressor [Anaerolineae bacterium]|nr:transcriptional repressor [Anaerolineae bacterium]
MSAWEELLAQAGHRVTEPRRLVMQLLLASETPLSPQTLFESARVQHHNLGLVTIYRTLELFESLGLVCRVHLKDGCHGYLAVSPGHHHFVICERCGGSVEFPGGDDLRALIADIEARTGYRIEEHLLQLLGLCPNCQGK